MCATPFRVHRCVGLFDELVMSGCCWRKDRVGQGQIWESAARARAPVSAGLRPHILTSHHPPAASRLPPQSAAACSPGSSFHYPTRLSCIERGVSRRHVSHRVGRACGSSSFPTLQDGRVQHRVRYCFRPHNTTTPNTVMAREKGC